MNDDVFDDLPPPDHNLGAALAPLKSDCEEAVNLTQSLKEQEALVKSMKSRLHVLRTKEIPDKMAEAGIGDTFSTSDGWQIKLGQIVSGSLPKPTDSVFDDEDPREIALEELIRLGGEGLIKNQISLNFGKGEYEKAEAAQKLLREHGFGDIEIVESVHAQSYCAFIREALKKGEQVNPEKLGVFVGPQAKLTAPKR